MNFVELFCFCFGYLNLFSFNNIETFDFTIGSENYKKSYCDKEMGIYDYVKLSSPIGIPYLVVRGVIDFLKKNPRTRPALTAVVAKLRKISDTLF